MEWRIKISSNNKLNTHLQRELEVFFEKEGFHYTRKDFALYLYGELSILEIYNGLMLINESVKLKLMEIIGEGATVEHKDLSYLDML